MQKQKNILNSRKLANINILFFIIAYNTLKYFIIRFKNFSRKFFHKLFAIAII